MIKAIFLDFDWTLYAHNIHDIPESAVEALNKAHENGIKVILATGRSLSELERAPEYRKINFDGYITMNGAICLDDNMKKIAGRPFHGKALQTIVDIFNSGTMPIVFANENSTYINFKNQHVIDAHKGITYIDHDLGKYEGEEIYLAVLFINQEEENEMAKQIEGVDFKRWSLGGVDMVPEGTDKTEGLKTFMKVFDLKVDECMAIGDSFNDKGIIGFAGIGVAMGNAENCVKQVSDYVTSDICEDGVANALRHFNVI